MTSRDLDQLIRGGSKARSGAQVTLDNAYKVATVMACVRVLASGVSQVPFKVMRYDGSGAIEVATDHPLYDLLHRRPNGYQTSYEFRETIMHHVVLTGSAYVWKGMTGRDRVLRVLEPIEPHRVRVIKNDDMTLRYRVRADNGEEADFDQSEIWHIKGPSWNGWAALDALKMAAEAIGLAQSVEQSQGDLHKNGAVVSGMLSVAGTLSPQRFQLLSEWLEKRATSGDSAGKPLIMDDGAKWTPFRMTSVDAQHIETRVFQGQEVCRALGVSPAMIGLMDKAETFASSEQKQIQHVVNTLAPWYERLEQSAEVNLLSLEDQRAGLYVKFFAAGLMRGAAKERAEFYATALGSGGHGTAWMTRNEVRGLEDLSPIEGGDVINMGGDNGPSV
jgi:HK97 family phage portal protein